MDEVTRGLSEAPAIELTPTNEELERIAGGSDSSAPEAFVRRADTAEVTEGLRAYFPEVVDATGVAAVMSEKEEEEDSKRRQRLYLAAGACVCLGIALGIIIPLVTSGNNGPPEIVLSTPAPTMAPSSSPTAAPTFEAVSEEFASTIEFIRQIENGTILQTEEWWNNRSSAPYQAAKWVSEEGNYTGMKLLQRYALVTFYYATTWDENWIQCDPSNCPKKPWLSSNDECNWGFVTCQGGNVIDLNFPAKGNGLSGTLPPQLSLLSQLQLLSIANNKVMGGSNSTDIDTSTAAKTLVDAVEHHNLHSIDQALYGLSSLEVLILYDNEFSGRLPTRVWRTNPDLQKVVFDENLFTGTIPDDLSAAANCDELQLKDNFITGKVPSSLGLLTSLNYLLLEGNRLTGSLPSELFALTKLSTLEVANNTQLTGDLNTNTHFTQLSNLHTFHAGFTQLQGTLSDSLFSSLTDMQNWDVQDASFRGTLSEELALWNASLQTLWLQNNQFTGALPTALDALTALVELRLEGNGFTGTISQTLCARRGENFQELAVLTVDCSVECTCCDFYEENCL